MLRIVLSISLRFVVRLKWCVFRPATVTDGSLRVIMIITVDVHGKYEKITKRSVLLADDKRKQGHQASIKRGWYSAGVTIAAANYVWSNMCMCVITNYYFQIF